MRRIYGATDEIVDILANASEILVYCVVGNADNHKISFLYFPGTNGIFYHGIWFVVLGAVQFDHQASLVAIKIDNIIIDHFLPQESYRVIS